MPSPNFAFLAYHDARLVACAEEAERVFSHSPGACLGRLRLFGELLAKRAAAKLGLYVGPDERQIDIINRLWDEGALNSDARNLFHDLRRTGNRAVHDGEGTHAEALHQLKMARELAVWFQRTYGNNRKFDPGPFVPPGKPEEATKELETLRAELERLQAIADDKVALIEAARKEAEQATKAKLTAEEQAKKEAEDREAIEALALEIEEQLELHKTRSKAEKEALKAARDKLEAELAAQQAAAAAAPSADRKARLAQAAEASQAIVPDEAATRRIIDKQLQDAGWDADSDNLTYAKGVRPQKNKNLAIAEWPTESGPADYVLFIGLEPVAIVEAKRDAVDVPGVIQQAKRYSKTYAIRADEALPSGSPWREYRIPFLFATNGREYLRQLATKSGVWFHDVRRADNHPRALESWYTPRGLRDLLQQDIDEAHDKLAEEPKAYLGLWDHQLRAIDAIETALTDGRRELLLAMATGTGKTRTCIGLVYRLLKTGRFRRVLFLVDRNALGVQAAGAFKEARLESAQTFADIFDLKELGDITPEGDTRLHIATIQAMVKRVIGPHDDASEARIPPVDQYDCIVVDECHRGYLLDRELGDTELKFRDQADYISKYRRVLDHFDAVKIGLTATPALHTSEIFGEPVFNYSYREAVVDGILVDHEPPLRIVTKLAKDGIHYEANEEVLVLDRDTNKLQPAKMPDEQDFEVDSFNRRVITEPFNRAVIRELVQHIDPSFEDKTLVFCADDMHCDMVVNILKEELTKQYDRVDDDAVAKITGKSDRPLELIRHYRNERFPDIAVTVDLLTTGIDVPKICNLVFLRRVRSRILYEQMLGRATRLSPEIGKERFRVFDAVDLYAALKDATEMKPVVVNPSRTFAELLDELLEADGEDIRAHIADEIVAKLQAKKSRFKGDKLEAFETAAGDTPKAIADQLAGTDPAGLVAFFEAHPGFAAFLDQKIGPTWGPIVSDHDDEVEEVLYGYGPGRTRPDDYIESFATYLKNNLNEIPALLVVAQRPRHLTRQQLKELKLLLDEAGFTEARLQTAWREAKNEDIAATIIGYIRSLALGDPLIPYADRVRAAKKRILASRSWKPVQRQWLERIASQLEQETIVDRAALDRGQFKHAGGGFKRLNKVFEGQLEQLLEDFRDEVWRKEGA